MAEIAQFNFTSVVNDFGEVVLKPNLPLELSRQGRIVTAVGLVDTGAEISVLPYSLGRQLGLIWKPSAASITLGGKLTGLPAQPAATEVTIEGLPATYLAFAWTQSDDVPLILGQTNFFMEFDVCFYRSKEMFEVRVKT
ncbi:MAG: hypothetical protein ACRD82_17400 [Blastocatellia bacterium]